jgi:outer membrane receptor for ferric coprogen and ferric-rhodotorulic acid
MVYQTDDDQNILRIYDGDHTVEDFEDLSTSYVTTTTTTTTSRSNSYKTPSPPLESITKTPTTLRSIRQEITIVRSSRVELSPTIDRLLRGALHNAEKGAMASAALDRMMEE